jgi:hypothetical protein
MAYVYRHIRHDKNEPFYIGIGKDSSDNYKRAYAKSKTKRSSFWHNIAKNGYDVDILIDGISFNEACEKEKEFILLYGRADIGTGTLCNLTIGGENPPCFIGDKNPMKRSDVREKVSKSRIGVKLTEQHRENIRTSKIKSGVIPPSRKNCKMNKDGIDKMLKSRMKNGKLRKKVYQYDKQLNLIKIWSYGKEIKDNNSKYSIGNIHMCCRKERPFAYGFVWSYIELTAEADLYFTPNQ